MAKRQINHTKSETKIFRKNNSLDSRNFFLVHAAGNLELSITIFEHFDTNFFCQNNSLLHAKLYDC